MRPRLELDVDFGATAPIAVSAFWLVTKLALPPLRQSPIEDDFHRGIGGKTFSKVLIEFDVLTCDDEQRPSHCVLRA